MMYQVSNPADLAMGGMGRAGSAYSSMMKDVKYPKPGKTFGGAAMSGLGAMGTAAAIGETAMGGSAMAAMGMTGGLGLAAGAVLGIGAYLLS